MNVRPFDIEISESKWDKLMNEVIVRHTQIALRASRNSSISLLIIGRGMLLIKQFGEGVKTYYLFKRLNDYLKSTEKVID